MKIKTDSLCSVEEEQECRIITAIKIADVIASYTLDSNEVNVLLNMVKKIISLKTCRC